MPRRGKHQIEAACNPGSLCVMLGVCLALVCASGLRGASAQTPSPEPRIDGRVTDKVTAAPIAHAEILVVGDGRSVRSDSLGLYRLSGLPIGTVHLLVRARGYPHVELVVQLQPGDAKQVRVELDPMTAARAPQGLPAVSVTAPVPIASFRLADFERRRRLGIGQYLTDEEIRSSSASNIQDATRGMRGVTLHCGGTEEGGCRIQMVRAPINCQPEYIVDERLDNVFGPLTPIRDIVALEVYTGPTDVPGEFAGRRAGCGVVVIWTRSAPPRRRH